MTHKAAPRQPNTLELGVQCVGCHCARTVTALSDSMDRKTSYRTTRSNLTDMEGEQQKKRAMTRQFPQQHVALNQSTEGSTASSEMVRSRRNWAVGAVHRLGSDRCSVT